MWESIPVMGGAEPALKYAGESFPAAKASIKVKIKML
jgi:hypothetical protein